MNALAISRVLNKICMPCPGSMDRSHCKRAGRPGLRLCRSSRSSFGCVEGFCLRSSAACLGLSQLMKRPSLF